VPRSREQTRAKALETPGAGIFVGAEPTSVFMLTIVAMVVWGILLPLQVKAALG
jgi:hypothetical protein